MGSHAYNQNDRDMGQPTGLKAFGWGFLGFVGANFIQGYGMKFAFWLSSQALTELTASLVFIAGYCCAVALAYWFAITRDYEATKTGAILSILLHVAAFVIGVIIGLGGI